MYFSTAAFIDGIFADNNLNAIGLEVLNTAESIDAEYLTGSAFSANGRLYFPGRGSGD